ncbi:MAG: hypothetical protein Q9182_007479 [Xanthomendoza sp. 2 TL-2023]
MEVLVKDLCNPDVVAAIAKRRFFFLKDKPNLTPEIWEKFRSETFFNKLEPPRKRSSGEEAVKLYKIEAKEAVDALIQLGGRPTGPIRSNPRWKTNFFEGELCYEDVEKDETIFYDPWYGYEPSSKIALTEARREHRPEKAKEEEMERQRYPQDPDLTANLKKVKDWKEYQVYFQKAIDRRRGQMEWCQKAVDAIQRDDPELVSNFEEVRRSGDEDWLDKIETHLDWIPAEEKRLEWAKQQLPAGELSQFDEELRAWKTFLDYRQKKETNGKTEAQVEEQEPAETTTQVKLWKDYEAYQLIEVNEAKQWVEFWQRQVEDCKEVEDRGALEGRAEISQRYRFKGSKDEIASRGRTKASPAGRDAVGMDISAAFRPSSGMRRLNDKGFDIQLFGESRQFAKKSIGVKSNRAHESPI